MTWLRRLDALAYVEEPGRDLRLDFLRGFAVFAMIVDHLAGPSKLYLLTGGNRFFTSAAEGFVFISGLLVGTVYRRIAEREGLSIALRRLLDRAWLLYVLAVALTLVMLPLSELLKLPWEEGVDLRSPAEVVWSIITLHQTYHLVDVPLLYALLLGLSPLAFLLLHEGRGWALLVVSWGVWAGYQIFPDSTETPWAIGGNNLFHLSGWQVLFFTAMVLGYHRDRAAAAVPRAWQWPLLLITGLGFAALIVVFTGFNRALQTIQAMQDVPVQGGRSIATDVQLLLFAKGDVRPGRIIASAVVFLFFFLLATRFWQPLSRVLGWLFLPLGQRSLYAYSAHVVVAVAVAVIAARQQVTFGTSPWLSAAVQLAGLALIWVAIRFRILMPNASTRRVWMMAPVPLAVTALVALRVAAVPPISDVVTASSNVAGEGRSLANAYGTPLTRERIARSFGTPIPRSQTAGGAPVKTAPSVLVPPLPAVPTPAPRIGGGERVSDYVGAIQGSLREVRFYSPVLAREMSYFAYLPPGYATGARRYPVLYLLHGGGGDMEEWPAYGAVDAEDRLIVSRDLRPVIMVMPQGDVGYWLNWVNDGPRWADYVSTDVIAHVDANLRTLPEATHRAVGGLSMGGHGALQLSFNHPDLFHGVGAHSPSLHVDDGSFEPVGTGADFDVREPLSLAQIAPGIDGLDIAIDVGDQDPWLERVETLHQILVERHIRHSYSIPLGGHEGAYWQRNLVSYLQFYDSALY